MEPMEVDDGDTHQSEQWVESSDINHLLLLDNILPNWKTKIISVANNSSNLVRVKFSLAARTKEEIMTWLKEFQEKTRTTYSIKTTTKCSGRFLNFKQRLYCHHNTKNSKVYDPTTKNRTKNTNCPSIMNIALRAVKKRHRSKNKDNIMDPEMPCVITLITSHNHPTYSSDSLRFRKVADETKSRLLQFYKNGHNAATALELLKLDIRLETENYKEKLADRKFCPSYNNCYYLYKEEFIKKFKILECDTENRQYLNRRVEHFNISTGGDSSRLVFHESGFALCICPPFLRRMHQYLTTAQDLVFVDYFPTFDPKGSRIFLLLTESECGILPLGVIVTSSQSEQLVTLGFELLQSMLGDIIFGGKVDGPCIFLTADSDLERIAITSIWKNSNCLLCTFHVLQTVWKWLLKLRNCILAEDQSILFHQFRKIAYAKTGKECYDMYRLAKVGARKYPHYLKYLKDYWSRKEMWALCYRKKLLGKEIDTSKSEAAKRILKEKLFEYVKGFNLIQMIDFLLTQFPKYYEHLLLQAFHNRLTEEIKQPSSEILEQIREITENIFLVPNESKSGVNYVVNTDALLCSCTTMKFCEHIEWACYKSGQFELTIDDKRTRNKLYFIATGKELFEIHSYCKVGEPIEPNVTSDIDENDVNDEIFIINIDENGTEIDIINDDENVDDGSNKHLEPEMTIHNSTDDYYETVLERGREVIGEITATINRYLGESPGDIVPALELFSQRLKSVDTKDDFVACLSNFATGTQRIRQLECSERNYNEDTVGSFPIAVETPGSVILLRIPNE